MFNNFSDELLQNADSDSVTYIWEFQTASKMTNNWLWKYFPFFFFFWMIDFCSFVTSFYLVFMFLLLLLSNISLQQRCVTITNCNACLSFVSRGRWRCSTCSKRKEQSQHKVNMMSNCLSSVLRLFAAASRHSQLCRMCFCRVAVWTSAAVLLRLRRRLAASPQSLPVRLCTHLQAAVLPFSCQGDTIHCECHALYAQPENHSSLGMPKQSNPWHIILFILWMCRLNVCMIIWLEVITHANRC